MDVNNFITVNCVCGKELNLKISVGQYQNEYRGDCECGREWVLTEISQLMAEIVDEEDI